MAIGLCYIRCLEKEVPLNEITQGKVTFESEFQVGLQNLA